MPAPGVWRKLRNDDLGLGARFHIATLIGEADNAIKFSYVHPLRIIAAGIETNSEWLVQSVCERFDCLRSRTVCCGTNHSYAARRGFRHKDIAVRCQPHASRTREVTRKNIHLEPSGNLQFGTRGLRYESRSIARRLRPERRRQRTQVDTMLPPGGIV